MIISVLAQYGITFLTYFIQLCYWSLIIWVLSSWLILFGVISHDSPIFRIMTQVVQPILKPFAWARIGMLDLSPLVAIVVLSYVAGLIQQLLSGVV